MRTPEGHVDRAVPSEMDIVDTFTHLIFCGADELTAQEASILQTLLIVDENAANASAMEIPRGVGIYLRALGVTEMIRLVARVREHYLLQEPPPAQTQSAGARRQSSLF